jgi:hypothetical protein
MIIGPAASGPATLTFPAPTNPDFLDSSVSLGTKFQVTTPGSWVGCRVRIASTLPSGSLVVFAGGIQSQSFVGVAGATMDVLFAVPTPVIPAVDYTAGYFTGNRYAFTSNPYPVSSPDGKIVASGGLFDYGPTPSNPGTATTLFFQVGPLVVFP